MNPDSRLLHLPHACRYAVSAAACLVGLQDGGYHMVGEIANRARLPTTYLAKILQRLARAGILDSRRGAKGGYRLARRADSVPLSEVVAASRGLEKGQKPCMIEAKECDGLSPCAMHPLVAATESALWRQLEQTTLAVFNREKEEE